jgi:serine/threonine protein kinase
VSAVPPVVEGYEYVSELGTGGYSDVYLYEQHMPRMKVAVKVLTAEGLTDSVRRQFTAEANVMAELADHPNIVQVFRAGIAPDGRPYLVMKYYPNRNLRDRAASEHLSVPEVLRVGIQIASAVETAHRAGILHRDIKPANILTSQYGAPGLTDFGIAVAKGDEGNDEAEGMSIPWAPPEVIYGTSPADERSDVYSLGATVWHLLVGRSPFEVPGGNNQSLAIMGRVRDTPPPPTHRADVPPSLERLLRQSLAKNPAQRPQTALSFARELQAIEQEQQFALTQIVVSERPGDDGTVAERVPRRRQESADLDNATRVRAPVVVDPTSRRPRSAAADAARTAFPTPTPTPTPTRAPTPVRPSASEFAPPPAGDASTKSRMRGAATEAPAEGTVRRAPSVAASPAEPARPVRRVSRRTAVASGAVLVAMLVTGALLIGQNGRAPSSSPTVSLSSTEQAIDVAAFVPPGTPDVTVKRADSRHITATWTYDAARSGDDFLWKTTAPDGTGVVKQATLTVDSPAGQRTCVEVRVRRADGSSVSSWSSSTCVG